MTDFETAGGYAKANDLQNKIDRIEQFLGHYLNEGQPGDVVQAQMAKAIMGIIQGEEVA